MLSAQCVYQLQKQQQGYRRRSSELSRASRVRAGHERGNVPANRSQDGGAACAAERAHSAALLYRGAKPSTRFALELSMKALRGKLVSALQRVKQTTNKAGGSNRLLAMAQRGLLQSILAGSIPSTCQKRVRLRRGRLTALAALHGGFRAADAPWQQLRQPCRCRPPRRHKR